MPENVKNAEGERALSRKFAAELADPKSGLLDAILDRAALQTEAEVHRSRPRRRHGARS